MECTTTWPRSAIGGNPSPTVIPFHLANRWPRKRVRFPPGEISSIIGGFAVGTERISVNPHNCAQLESGSLPVGSCNFSSGKTASARSLSAADGSLRGETTTVSMEASLGTEAGTGSSAVSWGVALGGVGHPENTRRVARMSRRFAIKEENRPNIALIVLTNFRLTSRNEEKPKLSFGFSPGFLQFENHL